MFEHCWRSVPVVTETVAGPYCSATPDSGSSQGPTWTSIKSLHLATGPAVQCSETKFAICANGQTLGLILQYRVCTSYVFVLVLQSQTDKSIFLYLYRYRFWRGQEATYTITIETQLCLL